MKLVIFSLIFSLSAMAFNPTVTLEYDVKLNTKSSDILFVIDNSGSMAKYQNVLNSISRDFFSPISGMNYRIAGISTDKTEILSPFFIEPHLSDPIIKLRELMIFFGDLGDANEYVYANTISFLKSEQGNLFTRDTNLEVIIVTDENEQSEQTNDDFLNFFGDKKVTINALIPIGQDCYSSYDYSKLQDMVQRTKGSLIDLCLDVEALSSQYRLLGESIFKRAKLRTNASMPLEYLQLQNQVKLESIQVFYGSQKIPKGNVHEGWVYDGLKNQIIFGKKIKLSQQPKNTKFTIQYDLK